MSIITLKLNNIDRASNLDWLYTNWEVTTSKNFDPRTIVVKSYEDRVNKHAIYFEAKLVPGKRYYARAQVVTNKGAHEWSNLKTWVHKAYEDVEVLTDLPSRISSPDVTTDSNFKDHVPTGFHILCKEFGALGEAVHVATSYWIETLSGKVVWKRLRDEISKNKVLVDNIVLRHNTAYRVKAVFHSSSNNDSQVSTKTIFVNARSNDTNMIKIRTAIMDYDFNSGANLSIKLNKHGDSKSLTMRLLAFNNGTSALAYEKTVKYEGSEYVLVIPRDRIATKCIYVLLVSYDNESDWKHTILNTFPKI